ncbi:UNVERIFIED_CONTAM: TBC1 domain family member 13 [Sesamum radiatum]|uniref:TBC1 domain family member 13 n=1 Tax=Sesamum radiatum TaxID=300843 RepID=A0AAW2SJE8_SESRA
MVKKRVPDWLNSSLWSSPQPPPSPPSKEPAKSPASPTVEPPSPPEPVRVSSGHATGDAKGGIRDPLSSNYASNSSTCHSDEENRSSSANSTVSAGGVRSAHPAAEDVSRQGTLDDLRATILVESVEACPEKLWDLPNYFVTCYVDCVSLFLVKAYMLMKSGIVNLISDVNHDKAGDTVLPGQGTCNNAWGLKLSRKVINMGELRRLASQGIPGAAGIRATVWKEALRNILIVFAKLNPGIKYVQGMNEILAPLFYAFKNDPDEENSVNPQFYAFRWITLLLTQEFNFTDCLLIWDTLLSDPDGPQETLLRICCAMLIIVRKRLLAGDFTSNLKLLQRYPSTNISHLLYVANKLRIPSAG